MSHLLDKEYQSFRPFSLFFLLSILSGFGTYFYTGEHWVGQQWGVLLHTLFGIFLSLYLVSYLFRHLSRIISVRRLHMHLSGWILAIISLLIVIGGLWMTFFGQKEAQRWVFDSHIFLSYGLIAILSLHLIAHRLMTSKRAQHYYTINRAWLIYHAIGFSLATGLLFMLVFSYQQLPSPYQDQAAVSDYQYDYGKGAFLPSQASLTQGEFIDPDRIGNSSTCGVCHQDIFQQWESSTHHLAASDPTYVTNVNLLEKNRGISATRYCEGCHAPVALLSGELSEGGKHGGVPDTLAFNEGVSCQSCHGMVGAKHNKGVASYIFNVNRHYLFEGQTNPWAVRLHNLILQLHPQAHRNAVNPKFVKQPELCGTCHEMFMDKSMNNWGWVKMQKEYSSWLNGPFSGHSTHTFGQEKIQTCTHCHLPLVTGKDPSSSASGKIFDHRMLGGNTFLPLLRKDNEQLKRTIAFLQSDKLSVTIDTPSRKDAIRSQTFLDESIRPQTDLPYYLYLGETAKLHISIANRGVGHQFPAGTTDINQAWLYFSVRDAENRLIYETGQLNADKTVDRKATFYQSIPIDRQGRQVWKHDLFRMVGDAYDRSIPAGGTDIVDISFQVPWWAKSPLQTVAILKYRKLNRPYATWALGKQLIDIPIIDMAQHQLSIPLIQQRPVVNLKP